MEKTTIYLSPEAEILPFVLTGKLLAGSILENFEDDNKPDINW